MLNRICKLFQLLGMFVAKCIQDGRRVDMPLSNLFFKLMCSTSKTKKHCSTNRSLSIDSGSSQGDDDEESKEGQLRNEDDDIVPIQQDNSQASVDNNEDKLLEPENGSDDTSEKEMLILMETEEEASKDGSKEDFSIPMTENNSSNIRVDVNNPRSPWFSDILDRQDLYVLDPYRGKFLQELSELISKRDVIMRDSMLSQQQKKDKIGNLLIGDKDKLDEMM